MRAAIAALALTGCFYIDPIVERPHAFIMLPGTPAERGGSVDALAVFDPARPGGQFDWTLSRCAIEVQGPNQGQLVCEDDPQGSKDAAFKISIPTTNSSKQLVTEMRVKLEARDDRGSLATAEDPIRVNDGKPTLQLSVSAHSLTAGAPIVVYAQFGDPELPYEQLDVAKAVTWEISPSAPLAELPVPQPPTQAATQRTLARRLVPPAPGHYVLTAVARDATCNASNANDPTSCNTSPVATQPIDVAADQPPCLASSQPTAPPADQSLPVTAPTVFEVPLVNDDLDAFPRIADDVEFGTTTFAWSIKPPGGARQVLQDATANRIVFDPGAYSPGDVVEVRVEIFDHVHTQALICDDAAATCAITPDASCLQRQTWRVEVR